jgi:hypothetical protein
MYLSARNKETWFHLIAILTVSIWGSTFIAARSVNFTRNLKPGLKQSCLPICEVLSRKPCWLFILTKNRPMTFILWPIRGIR